jgi:hypothetical protein
MLYRIRKYCVHMSVYRRSCGDEADSAEEPRFSPGRCGGAPLAEGGGYSRTETARSCAAERERESSPDSLAGKKVRVDKLAHT